MSPEAQPILHLKTFHPLDDHYGMSPMEAAMASVDIHNSAGGWSKIGASDAHDEEGECMVCRKLRAAMREVGALRLAVVGMRAERVHRVVAPVDGSYGVRRFGDTRARSGPGVFVGWCSIQRPPKFCVRGFRWSF